MRLHGAHFPVNHHLRPLYRLLCARLPGLYLLVFGVVGVVQTAGGDFFAGAATSACWASGTNLAFVARCRLVGGVVLLGADLIGRNLDHHVNQSRRRRAAWSSALAMLAADADRRQLPRLLASSTVIVTFMVGILVLIAGLYDRSGIAARGRGRGAAPRTARTRERQVAARRGAQRGYLPCG